MDPQDPKAVPRPHSGDHSGEGRERLPDDEYSKHRDLDELGTHGGVKKDANAEEAPPPRGDPKRS